MYSKKIRSNVKSTPMLGRKQIKRYGKSQKAPLINQARKNGMTFSVTDTSSLIKVGSKQMTGAYLKALVDPENAVHCHIPDLASYPCQTFTTTQEITWTPTLAGGAQGQLHIDLSSFPRYRFNSGTSVPTNFAWDPYQEFLFTQDILTRYRAVRLVGASARIEFVGSDANNSGILTGISSGRYSATAGLLADLGAANIPDNVNEMRNSRDSYVGAYKDGIYLTYRPLDSSSFNFQVPVPFTSGLDNVNGWGQFIIDLSNANANNTSIVYVTMHWEAITNLSSSTVTDGAVDTVYTNESELGPTQAAASLITPATSNTAWTAGDVLEVTNGAIEVIRAGANLYDAVAGSGGKF
jgi:hypothetical protein